MKYNLPPEEICFASEPIVWGGSWTEQKLDTFEKYVRAYLTIMNKYRDANQWKLIYFDGFAGSGDRTETEKQEETQATNDLFGELMVDNQELMVYTGAAERVVRIENSTNTLRGFDYYYFIDKSRESCDKLKEKLSKYPTKGQKVQTPEPLKLP